MSPDTNDMTMTEKVEAALRRAAITVLERARRTETPVIVWEDGRVVAKPWESVGLTPGAAAGEGRGAPPA